MNALIPPGAAAPRLVRLSCAECASTKFLTIRPDGAILCLGHARIREGEGMPPDGMPLAPEVLRLFDLCRCGADRGEHLVNHPHGTEDGACEGFVEAKRPDRDTLPPPADPFEGIDCVCGHPKSLHGILGPGPCLVGIGDQLAHGPPRCGCKAFHAAAGDDCDGAL